MDLSNLGGGSVRINDRRITVICDPLPASRPKADVVTLSSLEMERPEGAGMTVDGPGEYEVKGAFITGIPAQLHIDEDGQRGTIFVIALDDVKVAVLGNVVSGLSNEQLERIGEVDVLVVPVGGHGLTLDAEGAAQVVSKIEPKYVVPVHYDDGTSYAMPQDGVDKFLKEMGVSPEPMPKLKVNPKDMPMETTVVVLERS